jgi:hypothetical protein
MNFYNFFGLATRSRFATFSASSFSIFWEYYAVGIYRREIGSRQLRHNFSKALAIASLTKPASIATNTNQQWIYVVKGLLVTLLVEIFRAWDVLL